MITCLSFGFFYKLAAVPCHFWAAEVYHGCPQILMFIFILPIKTAVLGFVYKLFFITFKDIYYMWWFLFWSAAFLSMFIGAVSAVNETKVRKFLAFSSINQMGFLLAGMLGRCAETLATSLFFLFIYILSIC